MRMLTKVIWLHINPRLELPNLGVNVRVRNRAVVALLLPSALIFWMIGWVLFSTGSQWGEEIEKTAVKDYGIEISVGVLEEEAA